MANHDAPQEVLQALNIFGTSRLLHALLQQLAPTGPPVEDQLVLGQGACLITEKVVHLPKVFMQRHALSLTVQLTTGLIDVHHLLVVVHEDDVENLNHFKTDQQFHRHKLVEKQVEREKRINRHFVDIVSTFVEDVGSFALVLEDVLVIEKGANSRHDDDQEHVEKHQEVDPAVQLRLLEDILALVHDQLAVRGSMQNQTRNLPSFLQRCPSMDEVL